MEKNLDIISETPLYANAVGLIKFARSSVSGYVNIVELMTYYTLGKWIVDEQQNGAERANYGQKVIKNLSMVLTEEFGKGFSKSNLENARKFYLTYKDRITETVFRQFAIEKTETVFGQLNSDCPFKVSWSHYLQLMRIKNEDERNFYEIESYKDMWSVRTLQRQYNSSLYERLALSQDKEGLMKLATEGIAVEKPVDIIKQPTVLEFLGLEEKAQYVESDLETAILDKLQKFLLEMGKGYLSEKAGLD